MVVTHIVKLTAHERELMERIASKGKHPAGMFACPLGALTSQGRIAGTGSPH